VGLERGPLSLMRIKEEKEKKERKEKKKIAAPI
jgi:hypothetical protein